MDEGAYGAGDDEAETDRARRSTVVTLREFAAFRCMIRDLVIQSETILRGCRLFQEYATDNQVCLSNAAKIRL